MRYALGADKIARTSTSVTEYYVVDTEAWVTYSTSAADPRVIGPVIIARVEGEDLVYAKALVERMNVGDTEE